MATLADRIRQHVLKQYVEPARLAGKKTVTVRANEVHADLGLVARFPSICQVLDNETFRRQASVTLISRSGPPLSSTVEWVYGV